MANVIDVMSFEEFKQFLAETLYVRADRLTRDSSLIDDLALDSLRLVELMLQFELQLGTKISTENAWDLETIGDAYDFYVRQVNATTGR